VLQAGSPVCDARGPNYLEGAQPGHFWLRGALHPIRDGEKGILLVHCGMVHTNIEWLINRGGYVARLDHMPDDATQTLDEQGRKRFIRKNGNVVEEVREICVLLSEDMQPYVLPCTGSKHQFAREWNTHLKQVKHPETGRILPSCAHRYLLTTRPRKNALGAWFIPHFEDVGFASIAEIEAGLALIDLVEQGARRGDYRDPLPADSAA
jgi:hypothetical protein